jgi:hypothetical protein
MTLHVDYDHQCARCNGLYIPYDTAITCPKCDLFEPERFDFIPQALGSLHFNKASTGSYLPGGWYVGSLGDHILFLLFGLFHGYEHSSATDFNVFAREYLEAKNWADQAYLKDHVYGIAVRLYEEMKKHKEKGDMIWHTK